MTNSVYPGLSWTLEAIITVQMACLQAGSPRTNPAKFFAPETTAKNETWQVWQANKPIKTIDFSPELFDTAAYSWQLFIWGHLFSCTAEEL